MLYQIDSTQAIIHLQSTALASPIKYKLQLLKFCSNNFACISTFPCVRLKIVDLYKRNSQHNRATLPVSFSSLSVSLVFHKSFVLLCLVSVLFNPPHVLHCQQIGKIFFSKPYCFVLNRFIQEEW